MARSETVGAKAHEPTLGERNTHTRLSEALRNHAVAVTQVTRLGQRELHAATQTRLAEVHTCSHVF